MLISSDANGGEIVSSREETRFYDDLRCLAADWAEHRIDANAFVRIGDGRWTNAETALYARPAEKLTPMGSGLVAFATIGEARVADREGQALTFEEIVNLAGEAH